VPPVDTSATPWSASARANSARPVLSETEIRARVMRRRSAMARNDDCTRSESRARRGHSQRQFRLGLACADPRLRRRRRMFEIPAQPRRLPGGAPGGDLLGAARSIGAAEEGALLELDQILISMEIPQLAPGQ